MPRITPLPPRERSVCARLVDFRKGRGLTRAAVARGAGVNRFSFAHVENLRAPLGFNAGYNICSQFNLSLQWLATGTGPTSPFTPLSRNILDRIAGNDTFATIYDNCLAELVPKGLQMVADGLGIKVDELDRGRMVYSRQRLGVIGPQSHFERVQDFLSERAEALSDEEQIAFANELQTVGSKYFHLTLKPSSEKLPHDMNAQWPKVKVKPQWPSLKKLVQEKTAAPGAKTALAAALGVDLTQISKWLSDSKTSREPGADYALRMAAWLKLVNQNERHRG